MDFEDLVNTPRKMRILGISVAFMLAFPLYFQLMPSLLDDDMIGGGSSGPSGDWEVGFAETPIIMQESQMLGDGDTHDTFFDVMSELNIGYVELNVECNDNDDPGPGFTDSAEGNSDVSQVEGVFEDLHDDGPCSGGDSGFTLRWDVTQNYTGANYTATEMSESELRNMWVDGGMGRGTWAATITAEINSPPSPLGSIVDSDEEYDITWTAMTYELVLQPVIDVET
ncbi:MAG TPA: hypothetical protein EYQ15_00395 [Candidatus Poseidoniales archaeon]|jgi:hypothetical protein|nr:MAG: hypothetical protein CXT65_03760 [Euryarchaeota archaeon]HIG37765.1 hypothetical protein [Candidatus Poseidoniales archaeon]